MSQAVNKNPTFALALGGGGARGLAHIHVLEVLDELGIKPVAISGSSIGAIIGAAYASGISGSEIRQHVRTVLKSGAEVTRRLWQTRPGTFAEAFRARFELERILQAFLPEQVARRFEDLKTPLIVTATDYFGHKLHVIEQGELISAIAASGALPAVFQPITRDGRMFVDGGIFNPVPFDLLSGKADIVIGIDVVGAPEQGVREKPSAIDMMYGASQLMMQSIIAGMLAKQPPEIFLSPPVSKFRVLDFLKVDAILEESHSIRDDLKRAIEAAVEKH